MDEMKKIIEAALFMSGRWMGMDELQRITGSASVGDIKARLEALTHEYEKHAGGVRIFEDGGRYRMDVATEVRDRVYYLAAEPELSAALVKTLALIAYKQPIKQSEVVEVIGNRAYDYIKELRQKEFITVRKNGRSKVLSTTGHFRKYFGLKEGEMPWAGVEDANAQLTLAAAGRDKNDKPLQGSDRHEMSNGAEKAPEIPGPDATPDEPLAKIGGKDNAPEQDENL